MNDSAQREPQPGMITLGLDNSNPERLTENPEDGPRALTLTNLMLLWCFIAPFAGGMGFSKAGNCGKYGFIVALLVGLPLGMTFAYAMWRGFRFLFTRLSESKSVWIAVLVILTCIVWIGFAGWVGSSAEEAFFPKQSTYLKACRATHTCLTPQTSEQH